VLGCGGARRERVGEAPPVPALAAPRPPRPCPDDMVLVAERFCVDRFEASMVDGRTGRSFSPFYPPDLEELRKAVNGQPWGLAALGRQGLRPPVPLLPDWERTPDAKARAVSMRGVVPQGYLSKWTAKAACETAGKRLCRLDEWKIACRGDHDTLFPYGPSY